MEEYRSGYRILIADDDKNVHSELSEYFKREGYQVYSAYDGEEALEAFRRLRPDIVSLDIVMPKMDGITVCREIRRESNVPIIMLSAKTEEFDRLLEIFGRYPVELLIIHPRVRQDFYSGSVNMDAFRHCLENSKVPVCFNGNLCSMAQIEAFHEEFPQVEAVMLGRALVGDPAMLSRKIADIDTLQAFTDALLEEYIREFGGARNAMFRLKENWRFILCMFDDNTKLRKRLLKTTDVQEFRSITDQILHTLPLRSQLKPDWDL